MKYTITLLLTVILSLVYKNILAQSSFPDISPKWDNYYDQYPSSISNNHQASDFISVIRAVGFVPVSKKFNRNISLLEDVLLGVPQAALRQMRISGDYFSRTYKHDDYFMLYNRYYKPITKEVWDRNAPYLIPLMKIDGLINTNSN